MSDAAKQIEHEVKGGTEKVVGAVIGNDELREKGDEHLEEAHELEEGRDKQKLGISKSSDGTTHTSWEE